MTAENQLIEQLNDVGNRLLESPSSIPELLDLLDEVRAVLSKVRQKPSESVKEALLLSMKALIADELLRNSDPDVKIAVAACLNEIMRISAPVAPYDDGKMKEIFELIVSAFDKLSTHGGQYYSKAALILENVAKLRSCVMMLDLDCDALVTKMFKQFLKNISSNHPPSVLLAMETIMNVMIKESDEVSQELIKILLASIRKENQDFSPASLELGTKVIEACSEKLRPYIIKAVASMGFAVEDYAPILSIICKDDQEIVKKLDNDSTKDVVGSKPSADKSHSAEFVQALEAIEPGSKKGLSRTNNKVIGEPGTKSSKRGKKQSTDNHSEGNENQASKGKPSLGSPQSHLKKSFTTLKGELRTMPGEKGLTERVIDVEHKQLQQDTPSSDSSKKKGRQLNSDASWRSGNKENTAGTTKKDKAQTSDGSYSKSQRKRASFDDDFVETPYGRKRYKEDLVGCRIKVWWPLDHRYYEGMITSYDASTKKHKVDYDDGDEEILNLRRECWEFTGDELSADIDFVLDKRKNQPTQDRPQREVSTEGEEETSETHSGEKGATPESGPKSDNGTDEVIRAPDDSSRGPEVPSDDAKELTLLNEQDS